MKIVKRILSFVVAVLVSFLIATCIFTFVGCRAVVIGESMYPTYKDGDWLIVQKLTKPSRGSIITFNNSNMQLIKRVIGVPGDTVEIKDSIVYLNDKELKEDYLVDGLEYVGGVLENTEITLKDGEYIVLGDNRTNSKDSRVFGIVDEKDITGVKLIDLN